MREPSRGRVATLPCQHRPDLPARIAQSAERCAALAQAMSGWECLPAPALPPHPQTLVWRNWLFAGAGLRRGHVELFSAGGRFAVLHVCFFPAPGYALPIFGMDLVAGRIVSPGFFLDLTAAGPDGAAASRALLAAPPAALHGAGRTRPDWGGIFSPDFLCLRPPSADAAETALAFGIEVFAAFLSDLRGAVRQPPDGQAAQAARQAQRAYCLAQQQNAHTRRMLAGFVGEAASDQVMRRLLFPVPHPA